MTTLTVPAGYGLTVICSTATVLVANLFMGGRVVAARIALNVPYPHA
jgi:hypothetical protein